LHILAGYALNIFAAHDAHSLGVLCGKSQCVILGN